MLPRQLDVREPEARSQAGLVSWLETQPKSPGADVADPTPLDTPLQLEGYEGARRRQHPPLPTPEGESQAVRW